MIRRVKLLYNGYFLFSFFFFSYRKGFCRFFRVMSLFFFRFLLFDNVSLIFVIVRYCLWNIFFYLVLLFLLSSISFVLVSIHVLKRILSIYDVEKDNKSSLSCNHLVRLVYILFLCVMMFFPLPFVSKV
jgi:hypothetical protein